MPFQAYLDAVEKKTGKTPKEFAKLAQQKGLTKHGEIVSWLKSDFELGHGHANAIAAVLLKSETRTASPEQKLDMLFSGIKADWRKPCDKLLAEVVNIAYARFRRLLIPSASSSNCAIP